jgi:RNA polymerase sigma-70 factor (ECF subfamily)
VSKEQAITLYQPLLQAIAMRILGSVSDAEDMVQDAFVKWLTIDTTKVRNARAYLVKTVTNNCLNHLESIQRKKDELMDSIPQFFMEKWDYHLDIDKELSHALAKVHQKLEPLEKGIFLLREVFQLEYEEIQEIFQKKKDHCRQLLHRAKKKLHADPQPGNQLPSKGFIHTFHKACQHGSLQELISEMKAELK